MFEGLLFMKLLDSQADDCACGDPLNGSAAEMSHRSGIPLVFDLQQRMYALRDEKTL